MALSVNELADDLGMAPGDVRVLMAQYPGDVPMWEESGAVAPPVCRNLSLMFPPYGHRQVPERADCDS
jgi:hypothetical protein